MSYLLADLVLAYRKAKVDLFYSSNSSLLKIAEYEEDLVERLKSLLARINGDDEAWIKSQGFLGGWTLATKAVTWPLDPDCQAAPADGVRFSSPDEDWENQIAQGKLRKRKPDAEFRVMADCSLDFHVFSALWMLRVGHLYDKKLTGCASGNRLRRTHDRKTANALSLGSFSHYLKPFRDWQDRGINAMRAALDAGKRIVALTADVTSFYHKLNPAFMLAPAFVKNVLSIDLSRDLTPDDRKLNRLFIEALGAWAAASPLGSGLPVGLPASGVVANMALAELDRLVEQQVVPLYYGRYVDDILLVMENPAGFRSNKDVWNWVFARCAGKLAWSDDVDGEREDQVRFQPDYFKDSAHPSDILFANSKNKVFILAGETGRTLVETISQHIRQRASEWRAMPRLPSSASHVGADVISATQADGEASDSLRKTDALTLRRVGFAIKLRDFEAHARDLAPTDWADHRKKFFDAFVDHVIVLPGFFELAIYLPRVVGLATTCEDFRDLRRIIDALERLCQGVKERCTVKIKAWPHGSTEPDRIDTLQRWERQLFESVRESVIAAFPPRLSEVGKQEWQEHMGDCRFGSVDEGRLSIKELQAQQARLFSFDLAHMPFRFIALPPEMVAHRGIPAKRTIAMCKFRVEQVVPESIWQGIQALTQWVRIRGWPHGFIFATRPFSLPELFATSERAIAENGRAELESIVLALRGFKLNEQMPRFDDQGLLRVPAKELPGGCRIAVTNWSTESGSWTAAVTRTQDPDVQRYTRLNKLLDAVIAAPEQIRYLVFPELAMPARWFVRIANKLQARGIALISGVEYIHSPKRRVRNQVWAALPHDALGFPSWMIYRQDKQRPALHEERELQRVAGLKMVPDNPWIAPPVVKHGDFFFALLVCSELTNISYRAALRGRVDALFVPEWNKDTETFNALVESAALDIHAYVVQCNDREYGDSRIRAPHKDSWMRDILRGKGGISDYFVVGEIDIRALRQFQTDHRSAAGPFKPVPDGFSIAPRRMMPKRRFP